MRFFILATVLLHSAVLAAPAVLEARTGEPCAPISYILSDYILVTSAKSGSVNFDLQSNFAPGAAIEDTVIRGANCKASGTPQLPNNNECGVLDRKLLFDLRATQEGARYQITHTWVCNGKTWMSGTDVTVAPLTCNDADGEHTCSGEPQIIIPQNVRQICNSPRC